jgi:hypothetical protein
MKYAAVTGSDAMIYVPSFIEISSSIQKLIEEAYVDSMVMA